MLNKPTSEEIDLLINDEDGAAMISYLSRTEDTPENLEMFHAVREIVQDIKTTVAIALFENEVPFNSSSDINGETYGYGNLDELGFWQFQIPTELIDCKKKQSRDMWLEFKDPKEIPTKQEVWDNWEYWTNEWLTLQENMSYDSQVGLWEDDEEETLFWEYLDEKETESIGSLTWENWLDRKKRRAS